MCLKLETISISQKSLLILSTDAVENIKNYVLKMNIFYSIKKPEGRSAVILSNLSYVNDLMLFWIFLTFSPGWNLAPNVWWRLMAKTKHIFCKIPSLQGELLIFKSDFIKKTLKISFEVKLLFLIYGFE